MAGMARRIRSASPRSAPASVCARHPTSGRGHGTTRACKTSGAGHNPCQRITWTPRRAAIRKSTRAGSAIRWASGARRPTPSTGSRSRRPCSIPTPASMAAGFPMASATPATTRSTGMSKPAAARRPRSSTTRRSPARSRPSPTPRCRPRPRRSPASSSSISASERATASSSTCRWCRRRWSACWPARGWARCIRWCSAASRRRSSPPASTTPSPRSSSPRAAASRRRASFPTSRCSTRRSIWRRTSLTPA